MNIGPVSRRSMLKAGGIATLGVTFPATQQAAAEPYPSPQNFTYVNGHGGVPLNMVRTGNPSGPQIVFLHGFAHCYLVFKRQLESSALTRDFDLVAFDHRGHGNSGKPWAAEAYGSSQIWADDVAAIIAAAGNRKPTIVAWSYGATVLCDYIRHYGIGSIRAANFAGSLGGLVARANPAAAGQSKSVDHEKELSESQNIEDTIKFAEFAMERYVTPNMTAQDREAHVIMNAMTPPYAQKAIRARDRSHLDVASKLTLPVLISRGSEDWIISGKETDYLVKTLPNASQSVYPGAGHMTFIHDSERFNRELTEFVNKSRA